MQTYLFTPVRSTAFTTTSTSYVAVPGLSVAVAPGATYKISAYGGWQMSTQITTGVRLSLGGTCTASFVSQTTNMQTQVAGATSTHGSQVFTPASPTVITPGAFATAYGWTMNGLVVCSGAGNLQIMAVLGGTAGGTLTVATGSVMIVEQIA